MREVPPGRWLSHDSKLRKKIKGPGAMFASKGEKTNRPTPNSKARKIEKAPPQGGNKSSKRFHLVLLTFVIRNKPTCGLFPLKKVTKFHHFFQENAKAKRAMFGSLGKKIIRPGRHVHKLRNKINGPGGRCECGSKLP